MEQDTPVFLSAETRQDIEFYQGWIASVLLERCALDELKDYRDLFDSLTDDHDVSYSGLDEAVTNFRIALDHEIAERTHETLEELERVIFEHAMFRVGIVVDGETYQIDSITLRDGNIVPVIADGVYAGAIDDVLFDR